MMNSLPAISPSLSASISISAEFSVVCSYLSVKMVLSASISSTASAESRGMMQTSSRGSRTAVTPICTSTPCPPSHARASSGGSRKNICETTVGRLSRFHSPDNGCISHCLCTTTTPNLDICIFAYLHWHSWEKEEDQHTISTSNTVGRLSFALSTCPCLRSREERRGKEKRRNAQCGSVVTRVLKSSSCRRAGKQQVQWAQV
mmetsp:Transcript_10675/g.27957  ORF Transcript_10675/g.27957 Transcript_10675/m.27957 type:complete len:203 (-) Transcript_10675:41-649(-)